MKRIRDPLYGYIEIEDEIIQEVVDTATFQRLRSIIQTSYAPLFASAVHNRFVHSLGVYHLGKIAAHSIKCAIEHTKNAKLENIDSYVRVFEYACLLHDVGHAPFSHTGEFLYLDKEESLDNLHKEIIQLTSDSNLEGEIREKNYMAAPHELMSVIVGLNKFPMLFKDSKEKSFFARSILGYQYVKEADSDSSFLNCLISMLNSSLIDVDKLDYLLRDAYITGFDTVSIDYTRLLRSVIVYYDDQWKLAFGKDAISIIENVVFAHDAERKWIQNHPAILYESELLRKILNKLQEVYHIFSYDALTAEGMTIQNGFRVSLLSDADVVFLMKNLEGDSFVNEYFSRKDRRHPLWKSESEYKAIFSSLFTDELFKTMEEEFIELVRYVWLTNGSPELNNAAIEALNSDIDNTKALISKDSDKGNNLKHQLKIKEKHLRWIKCLKTFADTNKLDFDFLIIKANQFNSGFGKLDFDNIQIKFHSLNCIRAFKEVTNTLSGTRSDREKFFYIFVRRNSTTTAISPFDLARELATLIIRELFPQREQKLQ